MYTGASGPIGNRNPWTTYTPRKKARSAAATAASAPASEALRVPRWAAFGVCVEAPFKRQGL
jgi:hypothetical protein